ncbi:MAG: hypothetical protein H0X38_18605, partial [Planctomycetes bacterium]|nr:hypothetical protein [Planctomycetota bacterium]
VLAVALDQRVQTLQWRVAGGAIALAERDGEWGGETVIADAAPYVLVVPAGGGLPERVVARGAIQLEADRPPQVDLVADDRNRFVDPGQRLPLEVAASDDLGLSVVALWAHEATDPAGAFMIKEWRYVGPPGNPGPVKERHALTIAPERFLPGKTYVVEAIARDFAPLAVAAAAAPAAAQPVGQLARSQPLLLRVRSVADLALPEGDPLAAAFALLKQTLAEQQRARAVAANMAVNLDDIHRHNTFAPQLQAAAGAQDAVHATADKAIAAFAAAKDAGTLAQLRPLVEGVMVQLRADLGALADDAQAAKRLAGLIARQDEVSARLIALIGALAEGDRAKAEAKAKAKPTDAALDGERAKLQDKAEALKDDLERFARDQRRILERSRTLADKGPADLSSDEEKILGELAHEEKAWAKFLEEKLTDFSKLPGQDFADGRLADEFNEVWQDIKASAAALDAKAAEIAVPREGAGLEKAEKLVHNLERWMAESSDKTKWSMEDAGAPADVPLAELPKELEDIIGDLIDKEQEMTDEVQDVSSKWNDSIDKGAGWGAGDGPISNMSAKGITGNSLPNKNEVGGRSGEGRNGRSSGQMVEATAQGKGGQETPTRLSASPFEQGSVKDESKDSNGGATGGGKQAGFAAEGLRGPTPPPALQQAMARLAGKQAAIRQQAGALAIKLRAQHLPTGDLESAVHAMGQAEAAAQAQRGGAIKARYSAALD